MEKLQEAKINVRMWLELTIRACARELDYLEQSGEIADGEIQAPWDLLQKSIKSFREAQKQAEREADERLGTFV